MKCKQTLLGRPSERAFFKKEAIHCVVPFASHMFFFLLSCAYDSGKSNSCLWLLKQLHLLMQNVKILKRKIEFGIICKYIPVLNCLHSEQNINRSMFMPKLFEFSVMKIDTDKRSVMKIDSDKRSKLKSQMSCQILKRKIIRMKSNTLNIFF